MSADADLLLLDHVFQPAADRTATWVSCFDIARALLLAVIVLHTVVLAWDLALLHDPVLLTLVAGGTMIGYRAASQLRRQIARAERQSRPGTMNVQRIMLRPFRLAWLGFASVAVVLLAVSALRPLDLCNFALTLSWLTATYFTSCTPSPPPARTFRGGLLCPAAAS